MLTYIIKQKECHDQTVFLVIEKIPGYYEAFHWIEINKDPNPTKTNDSIFSF
jgi:hypothetical protein